MLWKARHGVRGRAKTAFGTGALATAVAIAGFFAAQACLPDLAAIAENPEAESGAPPFRGCGDGIIATLDDGGDSGESCDPGPDASIGCVSCQITCEDKLDPATGHCYFSPGTGRDVGYGDALDRCHAANAHLVTFSSTDEVSRFADTIARGESYWIGMSRAPVVSGAYQASLFEEPGFAYPNAGVPAAQGPCLGCFGVGVDPDSGTFPIADAGAPPKADPPQCVASIGGTWFQVACNPPAPTTGYRTICEREPAGVRAQACGNDGVCFTLPSTKGTKTYLVVVSSADPESAAQACNSLDGGSLVVLGSRAEREQLAHEIYLRNPDVEQQLWIGLNADGGAWTWEDGVPVDLDASAPRPPPWGNAQPASTTPARAYMRISSNAYDSELAYADDGGGAPRLFICQRPPQ